MEQMYDGQIMSYTNSPLARLIMSGGLDHHHAVISEDKSANISAAIPRDPSQGFER